MPLFCSEQRSRTGVPKLRGIENIACKAGTRNRYNRIYGQLNLLGIALHTMLHYTKMCRDRLTYIMYYDNPSFYIMYYQKFRFSLELGQKVKTDQR